MILQTFIPLPPCHSTTLPRHTASENGRHKTLAPTRERGRLFHLQRELQLGEPHHSDVRSFDSASMSRQANQPSVPTPFSEVLC